MKTPDAARSAIMRAVRSRDTGPERAVRQLLYALGYRYRLHRANLPGSPDLVFVRRRKVIFVHGCFWHGHSCKRGARLPKSNADYWRAKIARNRARDTQCIDQLCHAGWNSLIVWECELHAAERNALISRLIDFLGPIA